MALGLWGPPAQHPVLDGARAAPPPNALCPPSQAGDNHVSAAHNEPVLMPMPADMDWVCWSRLRPCSPPAPMRRSPPLRHPRLLHPPTRPRPSPCATPAGRAPKCDVCGRRDSEAEPHLVRRLSGGAARTGTAHGTGGRCLRCAAAVWYGHLRVLRPCSGRVAGCALWALLGSWRWKGIARGVARQRRTRASRTVALPALRPCTPALCPHPPQTSSFPARRSGHPSCMCGTPPATTKPLATPWRAWMCSWSERCAALRMLCHAALCCARRGPMQ